MNGKFKVLGKVFGTPVQVKGVSWLPVTQGAVWGLFTRSAKRRSPEITTWNAVREGFLHMLVLLGSEWCHNLAHALAAFLVGKPMDGFRIQLGMPRCHYQDLNPVDVTPEQHITRAVGGPIVSASLLIISLVIRPLFLKSTPAYRTANTAVQTNLFLSTVSLLPIPGIDGGPILKWSLVKAGSSVAEADRIVQKVNGPLAALLVFVSAKLINRKHYLAGAFSGMLGLTSVLVFTGAIKEEEVSL